MSKSLTGIIPSAGKGTRVAHLTNGGSKEMLEYRGKPLIQYAIDELRNAGVDDIIAVTHPAKKDLNQYLFDNKDITVVYQFLQQGLGDAIRATKPLISGPFVVLLPDVVDVAGLATKQLLNSNRFGLVTQPVAQDLVGSYGIVETWVNGRLAKIIEKPKPEDTDSTQAIMGRYYLPLAIMDILSKCKVDVRGEIGLTEALEKYIEIYRLYAHSYPNPLINKGWPSK